MRTIFALWIVAATALAAGDEPLFHDKLAGRLAEGWTWVHEQPGGHRIDEQGLWIRALPGTLWGGENNGRNQLVRPAPAGDVAVEVTLEMNPPSPPRWEQAGLLYYQGDNDFIKLVKEFEHDVWMIVMGSEIGGTTKVLCRIPIPDGPVRLRLEKNGDEVTGRFSVAGGQWQTAGQSPVPQPGAWQIGLKSQRGPANAEHWNRFNDLLVTRLEK